jgi:hypothetical protein
VPSLHPTGRTVHHNTMHLVQTPDQLDGSRVFVL